MKASQGYMQLIERLPLRPIRDEAAYATAIELVQDLALRYEELSPGEIDYFDALSQFVAEYERQSHAIDLAHLTPRDMVRFLMGEHAMSVTDLGRLLGNRSEASMILSGRRELSKKHIRALAAHFSVDASLFLGCEPMARSEARGSEHWTSVFPESDRDRGNVWTITKGKAKHKSRGLTCFDGSDQGMAA